MTAGVTRPSPQVRAELVLAEDEAGERHRGLGEHPEERRLDRLDAVPRARAGHVGYDVAGRPCDDFDVLVTDLLGERLREHIERSLGRGVGDAPHRPPDREVARHVHDASASLARHHRQRHARQIEHGVHVHVHVVVPVLVGHLGDERVGEDTGVVQQDVQPSGALDGLARRGDAASAGSVIVAGMASAVPPAASISSAVPRSVPPLAGGGVEAARGDDDGRAMACHREGELSSDAPAAAGDEGHLVGEVRGTCHGGVSLACAPRHPGDPHPRIGDARPPPAQREGGEDTAPPRPP